MYIYIYSVTIKSLNKINDTFPLIALKYTQTERDPERTINKQNNPFAHLYIIMMVNYILTWMHCQIEAECVACENNKPT